MKAWWLHQGQSRQVWEQHSCPPRSHLRVNIGKACRASRRPGRARLEWSASRRWLGLGSQVKVTGPMSWEVEQVTGQVLTGDRRPGMLLNSYDNCNAALFRNRWRQTAPEEDSNNKSVTITHSWWYPAGTEQRVKTAHTWLTSYIKCQPEQRSMLEWWCWSAMKSKFGKELPLICL